MGLGIHLAEGAPSLIWDVGHDPTSKLGSPLVPCREEARGVRPTRLHLSDKVVAADSVRSNVNSGTMNQSRAGRLGCFPQQPLLQASWKSTGFMETQRVSRNNNPFYASLSYLCEDLGERKREEAKSSYSGWSPE